MPVNFLTKEQQDGYGRFVDDPSTEDLEKFFYLDERDKALITKRRGSHNKLGFSTVICTVRYLGSFIEAPSDTPKIAVKYLARQLEISSPLLTFRKYSERSETYFEHVSEIKKEYGYQDLHNSRFAFKYSRWIYTRNWLSYERPSVLFDLSINWLRQRNILLPGISKLTRLISRVRDRVSEKQWKLLSSLPNDKQIQNLESLLSLQPPSRNTLLEQLRRPPSIISSNSLVSALNRVEKFKKLGIDNLDLSIIPPARRYELSRFASVARAQAISRMPSDRRISTLLGVAGPTV